MTSDVSATDLVCIDRPCKLKFTIHSITNAAALSEPMTIYAHTRGACASSTFSRPKVKGKSDPKNPSVEPFTLLCDVWWRPVVVRFGCSDASDGSDFPAGEALLGAAQWELLHAVECCGRGDGPECDFSIDLTAPGGTGTGDAVLSLSGKVCAVWDEDLCEGAACVGDTVEGIISAALAEHDEKRLNALAADLTASVSLTLCLSTIDLLSTQHEYPRALLSPDVDCAAPAGDVHMRGVLPVIRRPPHAALKVNGLEASATNAKVAVHAKPPSAKSTPRAATAADAEAPARPLHTAVLPLQPAAQVNSVRPATAHPARKPHDAHLLDLDDDASLHSGSPPPPHPPPPSHPLRARLVCFSLH
jgi:hypothetical protein